MHLRFADATLARVCSSGRLLQQRWGRDRGLAVGRSLLALHAAPDLTAVRTIPSCRSGSDSTEWSVSVPAAADIIFIPCQRVDVDDPWNPAGLEPWLLVTKLEAVVARESVR